MPKTNKVEFGLKNVHVAEWTETDGVATIGTPEKINGAVDMSIDVTASEKKFHADDIVYYVFSTISGRSANLTMALFPDAFKIKYLGYKVDTKGGVVKIDNAKPKPFVLIFEGDGDAHKVRHLLFNCVPGNIQRGHKTVEDEPDVETEVLAMTVVGTQVGSDQVAHVYYSQDTAGYATAITAPTLPEFTTEGG